MTQAGKAMRGFTLIELMIAVAIVGIIAAFAIPSYQQYATQSRRAEVQSYMLEMAMALEKYRASCPTYAVTVLNSFTPSASDPCKNNAGGAYTLAFTAAHPSGFYTLSLDATTLGTNTYKILATPQKGQQTRDSGCGTLSLDQTGIKLPSGCWKK